MTDEFERLIETFPPEDLVDKDDPSYPDFEANGGCRTCANGEPCQERIRTDIDDILEAAGLPETERLSCLQWLIREGCSTLTRSISEMVEAFSQEQRQREVTLIATQNDEFRSHAGLSTPVIFHNARIEGIVFLTDGVNVLPPEEKDEILRQVRQFNEWTPENDPYGEHDFGRIESRGERIFFKFDYYDRDYTYGSEHPANLAETARVLTIMLAQEY